MNCLRIFDETFHVFLLNSNRYQTKGIIKFMHMNGNDNPDDIVTNIYASKTWFILMKYILFWREMDFIKYRVVSEESDTSLSTPSIYQAKGTHQYYFNIDLWLILDD